MAKKKPETPAKSKKAREEEIKEKASQVLEELLTGLSDEDIGDMPGVAKEEDYLEAIDQYLPFSTSIRADQYIKLKRLEYWSRRSIRELFETILETAFAKLPQTKKELPPAARTRLKPLLTANDYYQARVTNKTGEGPKKKKE